MESASKKLKEKRQNTIELSVFQSHTLYTTGLEKNMVFSKKPKKPVFWVFCSKFYFKHKTFGCFLSRVGFWAEKSLLYL
jgi:hypothetical protein